MYSASRSSPRSDDGCRRGRDLEERPCGQVDALVGGLRRQHHGDQQLERRFVFEFGPRVRIQAAQPLVNGSAFGGIHRFGRASRRARARSIAALHHGLLAGELVWRQIVAFFEFAELGVSLVQQPLLARLALDREALPTGLVAGARLAGVALGPLRGRAARAPSRCSPSDTARRTGRSRCTTRR